MQLQVPWQVQVHVCNFPHVFHHLCVTAGFPNVHAQSCTQSVSVPRPKTKEKTCGIDEYRKYLYRERISVPIYTVSVRILLGLISSAASEIAV
jgi:hypothetical protein